MFWAAVGPVSREKESAFWALWWQRKTGDSHKEGQGVPGPSSGCWTAPAGEVRQLSPGLTAASSVPYRAVMEMCGASPC